MIKVCWEYAPRWVRWAESVFDHIYLGHKTFCGQVPNNTCYEVIPIHFWTCLACRQAVSLERFERDQRRIGNRYQGEPDD